ncbi:MAG: spherulation-specific family 4 protein [Pseudonocardia sp.]
MPAYFHPVREADSWARLDAACARDDVGIVVINPDSGFGTTADDAYRWACSSLCRSGTTVAGYVDTAYASRPHADVVAEVRAYVASYGVGAAFLDQVTSTRVELPYYRELVRSIRRAGVGRVVLNPGVGPDRGYLEIADVVVTFEGPWAAYAAEDRLPARRRRRSAATWHLVHSTPPREQGRVIDAARRRGAAHVYVTERTLPNPWDRLPARWESHPGPGGSAPPRGPGATRCG